MDAENIIPDDSPFVMRLILFEDVLKKKMKHAPRVDKKKKKSRQIMNAKVWFILCKTPENII